MSADVLRVLLATSNPGKVRELQAHLAGLPVEVCGLRDVPLPPGGEVEETGDTFAANAILKAVGYGRVAGLLTLADDSGLEVDALGGAPGVYSARFAGHHADDATNNALLLERLAGREDRSARFRCVVAVYVPPHLRLEDSPPALPFVEDASLLPGERLLLSSGAAEGDVLTAARGEGGFGYDPLFLSRDLGVTFAEAPLEAKAQVSHRGRALAAVIAWLKGACILAGE